MNLEKFYEFLSSRVIARNKEFMLSHICLIDLASTWLASGIGGSCFTLPPPCIGIHHREKDKFPCMSTNQNQDLALIWKHIGWLDLEIIFFVSV